MPKTKLTSRIFIFFKCLIVFLRNWIFATNSDFLISISNYLNATQSRRPLIFQTMNAVRSYNISLKYQRSTSSGCKDIGITKIEFLCRTFDQKPFEFDRNGFIFMKIVTTWHILIKDVNNLIFLKLCSLPFYLLAWS